MRLLEVSSEQHNNAPKDWSENTLLLGCHVKMAELFIEIVVIILCHSASLSLDDHISLKGSWSPDPMLNHPERQTCETQLIPFIL